MSNVKNIIEDRFNQKWGALLDSGHFRHKRSDILGRKMYEVEHSVSQENLTLQVSSRKDLHSTLRYISDVISMLDDLKETSFLTGRNRPQEEKVNILQKLANFVEFNNTNPDKIIEDITSGSNCKISNTTFVDEHGINYISTLKIKLNPEDQKNLSNVIDNLEKGAFSSEKKFQREEFLKNEDAINYKNVNLIDDIREQKALSLGNDNDRNIVHTFLKDKLSKYNINYPIIEFKDERDPEDKNPDLLSEKNLRELYNGFYHNQAYNQKHTINFHIPSTDFVNEYNSLYKDLKKVFDGVYSVFPNPDPLVTPLDPESHTIGDKFEMSVRGSFARLAGDIKKNAREEYDAILNKLGIREK